MRLIVLCLLFLIPTTFAADKGYSISWMRSSSTTSMNFLIPQEIQINKSKKSGNIVAWIDIVDSIR